MHLLAAKPGGYTDDEGIVDLAQTPGDIVILSAADSSLAALADAVENLPADYPPVRLANWMQLLKPAAFDLYQDKVLDHAREFRCAGGRHANRIADAGIRQAERTA